MSSANRPLAAPATFVLRAMLAFTGAALLHCSSPSRSNSSADGGGCFQDADGLTGGPYTINLTVDDNGFSKTVLNTQNDATVTFTLTNSGTKPHGFVVDCASVTTVYPNLPAQCPSMICFPSNSTIAPIAPGASTTIMFFTPTPDNIIYPFKSSEPSDAAVPGLNGGQWSVI